MALPLERLKNTAFTEQLMHKAVDDGSQIPVLSVTKPSALIQAVGYLKFNRMREVQKSVYCRGQSDIYSEFKPTLHRQVSNEGTQRGRGIKINTYLKKIKDNKEYMTAIPSYAHEAVLQHYGLRTRWLDVVDNIWVALWFACHKAITEGRHHEFLHFERRQKRKDGDFAFIYLIESANTPVPLNPGYFQDANSSTIDLRIACPSHFIRPHAQHGLLVRSLENPSAPSLDYGNLISGIVRIDLDDALDWLGNGYILSAHSLFPPPVYDFGYRELLNGLNPQDKVLGRIQHIGA